MGWLCRCARKDSSTSKTGRRILSSEAARTSPATRYLASSLPLVILVTEDEYIRVCEVNSRYRWNGRMRQGRTRGIVRQKRTSRMGEVEEG